LYHYCHICTHKAIMPALSVLGRPSKPRTT
jgi:hypothetical protein